MTKYIKKGEHLIISSGSRRSSLVHLVTVEEGHSCDGRTACNVPVWLVPTVQSMGHLVDTRTDEAVSCLYCVVKVKVNNE